MEEKKILTDEELDNVVGGQQAYDTYYSGSANIDLTKDKNNDLLGMEPPHQRQIGLTKDKNKDGMLNAI